MKELLLPLRYQKFSILRLITLSLFVGLSFTGSGQNIQINLVDENNLPVSNAIITLKSKPDTLILTDENGKASFNSSTKSDSIFIQKVGWATLKISQSEISGERGKIIMIPIKLILDEVHVVGMSDWSHSRFAQNIEVIAGRELQKLTGKSTVDILESTGEIFVQRSQLGGGSPIVRGFEANRILLVVDGVRMNNAIYRSGHLHNSVSIDQFGLSSIEIHLGPNSLLYGSDALGGVLHFKTKNASFSADKLKLSNFLASTLYQSAANNFGGHLDFSISSPSFSSFTSFSYNSIGDLRTGDKRTEKYSDFGKRLFYVDQVDGRDTVITNENVNLQIGSAYEQFDLIQKFNFKINNDNIVRFNFQYSDAPTPRYDQLNIISNSGVPEYAEWNYTPQQRFLSSVTYDILKGNTIFDRARFIGSYQKIKEGRRSRFYQSEYLKSNNEELDVFSFSMDMVKSALLTIPIRLYYGAEIQGNKVTSTVESKNINTGDLRMTELTRYPSGENDLWRGGIYSMVQTDFNESKWRLDIGLRHNWYKVGIQYLESDPFEWPDNYADGVTISGQLTTFSGAISWHPIKHLSIKAIASTAFRAPNIDDIAKIRIKNGQVLTPNLDLKPESTRNNEVSINWKNNQWQIQLLAFSTRINNIIVRTNGTLPNGDTIIISDGRPFRVQINDNRDQGHIIGSSFDLKYMHPKGFHIEGSVTNMMGKIVDGVDDGQPLAHIPPLYGKLSMGYSRNAWEGEIFTLFNGAKPLDEYADAGSDNDEYATSEGTLPWSTLNARIGYQHKQIRVGFRLENILDKHYRTFSSGISASGFNATLQFSYTFYSDK